MGKCSTFRNANIILIAEGFGFGSRDNMLIPWLVHVASEIAGVDVAAQ